MADCRTVPWNYFLHECDECQSDVTTSSEGCEYRDFILTITIRGCEEAENKIVRKNCEPMSTFPSIIIFSLSYFHFADNVVSFDRDVTKMLGWVWLSTQIDEIQDTTAAVRWPPFRPFSMCCTEERPVWHRVLPNPRGHRGAGRSAHQARCAHPRLPRRWVAPPPPRLPRRTVADFALPARHGLNTCYAASGFPSITREHVGWS